MFIDLKYIFSLKIEKNLKHFYEVFSTIKITQSLIILK